MHQIRRMPVGRKGSNMLFKKTERNYFLSEGKDKLGKFYKFGPFKKKDEVNDFISMITENHGDKILGHEIYKLRKNHLMMVAPEELYVKVYIT